MTTTTFPFELYYSPHFIDPLYAPYMFPSHKFNPLTMNKNEVRYNWGYDFKKKHSDYPCPMGFRDKAPQWSGYCERHINQTPLFYMRKQNEHSEFFPNTSRVNTSIYPL